MELARDEYATHTAYDELLDRELKLRPAAQPLFDYLNSLNDGELAKRQQAVDATIMAMGITFTVYSEAGNIDRVWPFDPIPRVMGRKEWESIQAGLKQRLRALNLFINDLYNEQRIIKDGVFPAEVLEDSANFRPQCVGITPRFGVWAHICGT
ncbi:MAG: circularly permuted type 2 ATP-grasp protein, partial [Sideroxydans sp.]|nr:circularly permuted type 2 ATP-grasp protein [Sideroxydans sp.]